MAKVVGDSADANPAVAGTNSAGGDGVRATSTDGNGLSARSTNSVAIFAESTNGFGVTGIGHKEPGVSGTSDSSDGVRATSTDGNGLSARSTNSVAIFAESTNGFGVAGIGHKEPGVSGTSDSSDGVRATSTDGNGLSARSTNSVAIFAESTNGFGVTGIGHKEPGVSGTSDSSDGVRAASTDGNGLSARSTNGVGGFFQGGRLAAFFEGDVTVTGNINTPKGTVTCNDMFLSPGSGDCAEEFDSATVDLIEPGTVVVFEDDGAVRPSHEAYDRRVAGIVSGAGSFKPAIILDRGEPGTNRLPIALLGKVYCKVDAQYSTISVGDLLTTSPTAGHAMKAADPVNAFGAVIGKALRSLESGQGLIPVLVSLQ